MSPGMWYHHDIHTFWCCLCPQWLDSANLIYYYKPFGLQGKGRFPVVIQKNQLNFFHESVNKNVLDVVNKICLLMVYNRRLKTSWHKQSKLILSFILSLFLPLLLPSHLWDSFTESSLTSGLLCSLVWPWIPVPFALTGWRMLTF